MSVHRIGFRAERRKHRSRVFPNHPCPTGPVLIRPARHRLDRVAPRPRRSGRDCLAVKHVNKDRDSYGLVLLNQSPSLQFMSAQRAPSLPIRPGLTMLAACLAPHPTAIAQPATASGAASAEVIAPVEISFVESARSVAKSATVSICTIGPAPCAIHAEKVLIVVTPALPQRRASRSGRPQPLVVYFE